MVKIEPALFNKVWGSAGGKTFKTYTDKRKIIMTHKKPIPSYTRSPAQDSQRNKFKNAVAAWNELTEEEKQQYEEQARPYGLTGYQYFIQQQLITAPPAAVWYKVTIDNSDGTALSDYQILIEVINDEQFFNDAQDKKEAIMLYDSDKETELSYWIEEFDTTNHNAKIWVKVPSIPAGDTKIIYISVDPARTTDESDAEAVFIFFDHFDAGSLDTSKWDEGGTGLINVSDSELKLTGTNESGKEIKAKVAGVTITDNVQIEALIRVTANNARAWKYGFNNNFGTAGIDAIWLTQNKRFGNYQLRSYDEGNYSYNTYATPPDQTVYRVYKITMLNHQYKLFIDGAHQTTLTNPTYEPDEVMYAYIASPKNYDPNCSLFCDWIRIRKYTDTEPSVSYTKEA